MAFCIYWDFIMTTTRIDGFIRLTCALKPDKIMW
jgi:hypothetical protein